MPLPKRNDGEDSGEHSKAAAVANWRKLLAVGKFLSLANTQAREEPAHLVLKGRYLVGRKLNNGAFGQVRLGQDLRSRKRSSGHSLVPNCVDDCGVGGGVGGGGSDLVAIKLEPCNAKIPMLAAEYGFYRRLAPQTGFPQVPVT